MINSYKSNIASNPFCKTGYKNQVYPLTAIQQIEGVNKDV